MDEEKVDDVKVEFPPEAIAAISAQRARAREAEMASAELKGKLSAFEQAQVKAAPAKKSPLEVRAEEEGVSVGEVTMDGSLYKAQQMFDRQTVNAQADVDAAAATETAREESRQVARGEHDDWNEVIEKGQQMLTQGEILDINNAGKDYGVAAYKKCAAAIKRNEPKEDVAPEKKEPSEEVPTQDEILKEYDPIACAASLL